MATLKTATPALSARASVRATVPRPFLSRKAVSVRAQLKDVQPAEAVKALGIAGAAATLMSAGSAQAATELLQLAASDNRTGIILSLGVPVLAWAAFNIAGPAFAQLDVMGDKAAETTPEKRSLRLKKSVAGALGLGAAGLLAAQSADAATEIAQLAASDNRTGIILSLGVPVLAWAAFNIAGPAFAQLDVMGDKAAETTPEKRSLRLKKSVAGALGLGAAGLLAAQSADAATEIAQLAASDNRFGIILTLGIPVLAWVAFNIAGPAFAQLDVMGDKAKETTPEKRSIRKKRSVAGALGLGAAGLLAAQSADAATEIAQLAASDNRTGIILSLGVPVLAWAAFNIAGPAFAQLDVMGDKAAETTPEKRSLRLKK